MSTARATHASAALRALPWGLERGATGEFRGAAVTCVKRTRSRCVLRLPAAALGVGENGFVFAKRYANKFWWRRVVWLVGQSKAAREAAVLRAVREARGLDAPEPLATAADWSASYLLTREMPGLRGLGEEIDARPVEQRLMLWREAGAYVGGVWAAGVFHPDLLQEHLCLWAPGGADGDARRFALIDCDGVALYPGSTPGHPTNVPRERRLFNAMQVLRSLAPERGGDEERITFLAAAFGGEWERERDAIVRGIQAAAAREDTRTHLEHLAG